MRTASKLRKWLMRLFALLCIFAASGVAVIALSRLGILTPGQSLTLGAILFFASIILQRQFEISRDLKKVNAQFMALDEYEGDIKRRLDDVTHRLNAIQHPVKPQEFLTQDHVQDVQRATASETMPRTQDHPDLSSIYKVDTANFEDEVEPIPLAPKKGKQSARAKLPSKLDEKSLSMHLQPIVDLATRRPLYFDAFMRLNTEAGQFFEQNDFFKLVETAGLSAKIDKKVVFSAVRMVRKLNLLKKQAGVFCSVSPTTLLNQQNSSDILRFLKANSNLAGTVIVEIRQRDWVGLNHGQRDRLQELADIGVPLSLGSTLDLQLDSQALARCGFKYVKVPVSILLHASVDADSRAVQPSSLSSILAVDGIDLIATEVERDREAIGLIDIDVSLAQGLLFAPPRPVKAELLMNGTSESTGEPVKTNA